MKHLNLMVDIETLGSSMLNPVIVEIGWAVFDPEGQGVESSGSIMVDPQSCLDIGMLVEAETLQFWMEQPDEARLAVFDDTKHRVSIHDALLELGRAYASTEYGEIWSNPADFDLAILREAFYRCNKSPELISVTSLFRLSKPHPSWDRRRTKCVRTLLWATGTDRNAVDETITEELIPHLGEHDCIRQCYWVQAAMRNRKAHF